MQVISEGSVRVDLVGGTLDLDPINVVLPNVMTLNVATSLKAKVHLEEIDYPGIKIYSADYAKEYIFEEKDFSKNNLYYENYFQEMTFICQILDLFEIHQNLKITLSSGAPAGSGLGGSSAMGVTLYKALCEFTQKPLQITQAVRTVKSTEARILNQGVTGYQDYYPALVGGVLALYSHNGEVAYEQLYSPELKEFLEDHVTLVYSGISRQSGINNWEVYKAFFDKNVQVREQLGKIADISHQTYLAIKEKRFDDLLSLISQEGLQRELLVSTIVPYQIQELFVYLMHEVNNVGMKMCGAGGGGCFILVHPKESVAKVSEIISQFGMKQLDFSLIAPLEQ